MMKYDNLGKAEGWTEHSSYSKVNENTHVHAQNALHITNKNGNKEGIYGEIMNTEVHKSKTQIKSCCSVLDNVPCKIHVHLKPQNVSLFGNRVFVDVMSEGRFLDLG